MNTQTKGSKLSADEQHRRFMEREREEERKMNKDNATSRPWRKSEDRKGNVSISTEWTEDAKTEDICTMEGGKSLKAHHNANLIIRAVNNHDALLEACKSLRQELVNYNCSCKSAIQHIGGMAIHQADQAIAQAEARS